MDNKDINILKTSEQQTKYLIAFNYNPSHSELETTQEGYVLGGTAFDKVR